MYESETAVMGGENKHKTHFFVELLKIFVYFKRERLLFMCSRYIVLFVFVVDMSRYL